MAAAGLPEERTHDLGRLLEILEQAGIGSPPGADWLDDLTIYAVPMRYDELLDVEPLDRDPVVALVGSVAGWARDRVRAYGA